MSERDQFVGQPRNYTLSASIELGRNGLSQRGYLRDLHAQSYLSIRLGLRTLQLQSLAFCADPCWTAPCGYRVDFNLGSARPSLPRARSVSRSLLSQEASRLE